MSADRQINLQPELPDVLSAIEAQLKHFEPASSGVNRDELMYQAGWAAAQAESPTKPAWLWPATSAALAASLLFVLTTRAPTRVSTEVDTMPAIVQEVDDSNVVAVKNEKPAASTARKIRTKRLIRRRYGPQASLLSMRERALRFEFDEPTLTSVIDDGPISPSTNRELMREFLPESPTPTIQRNQSRPWWSLFRLGESA